MPTLTTKLSLNKPLVNNATDEDLWGTQLNTNMDTIDAAMTPVLLNTTSPSGAASVTFSSSLITSTYRNYFIMVDSLYGSAAAILNMTISTNNGSVYLSSNYEGSALSVGGGTVDGDVTGSSAIALAGTLLLSTTSTKTSAGRIWLNNPMGSMCFNADWELSWNDASTQYKIIGSAQNSGTTAINNVKIAPASGTITGTFRFYGY